MNHDDPNAPRILIHPTLYAFALADPDSRGTIEFRPGMKPGQLDVCGVLVEARAEIDPVWIEILHSDDASSQAAAYLWRVHAKYLESLR